MHQNPGSPRGPRAVRMLITLPALATGLLLAHQAWVSAQTDPLQKKLVGTWETEDRVKIVYSADGTGKNHDGSRFKWRLKPGLLVAQTISKEGADGPANQVPIAFSRDGKEYKLLLEGGRLQPHYYRLLPNGQRDSRRTAGGRAFPPDPPGMKRANARRGAAVQTAPAPAPAKK
jgi:hypothetical protein